MKIKSLVLLLALMFTFGAGYADTPTSQTTNPIDQAIAAARTSQAELLLAGSCPSNCSSCWDQCTKSDDCGSGHKCISTACGNRCTKE